MGFSKLKVFKPLSSCYCLKCYVPRAKGLINIDRKIIIGSFRSKYSFLLIKQEVHRSYQSPEYQRIYTDLTHTCIWTYPIRKLHYNPLIQWQQLCCILIHVIEFIHNFNSLLLGPLLLHTLTQESLLRGSLNLQFL